ncbi:MAG: ATP-binding protein [Chloroflexi bacterium]|nr:ATP-binding protein [Chloroflexota bacterium]MBP7041535.1 ATP-binding protein [Chloroflexota bacterium]
MTIIKLKQESKPELTKRIEYHFNDEELKNLVFILDDDPENVLSNGKPKFFRCMELVDYMQRRARESDLLAELKDKRSSVAWENYFHIEQSTETLNLPSLCGTFVGRESELQDIQSCLQSEPNKQSIVVILGPRGLGKRELALKIVHLVKSSPPSPNGYFKSITWVEAKDPASFKNAKTKFKESGNLIVINDFDFKGIAEDKDILEVLNNLQDGTKVIITSNKSLKIKKSMEIALKNFSRDETFEYLEEVSKVELTEDQKEKIYVKSDGFPEALRWIVEKIRPGSRDYWIGNFGKKIDEEKILDNCFRPSLEKIQDESTIYTLMALSRFEKDASRETLGFVTKLTEGKLIEALDILQDLCLVYPVVESERVDDHKMRYEMNKLFQQYVRNNLFLQKDASSRSSVLASPLTELFHIDHGDAIRKSMVNWILGVMVIHGENLQEIHQKEFENIMGVLSWCYATDDDESILDLIRWTVKYFDHFRDKWADRRHHLEKAKKCAERLNRQKDMDFIAVEQLWLELMTGNLKKAIKIGEDAELIFNNKIIEDEEDLQTIIKYCHYFGEAKMRVGCNEDARKLLLSAYKKAKKADDIKSIILSLYYLGKFDLYMAQSNKDIDDIRYKKALKLFHQSLLLSEEIDWPRMMIHNLLQKAECYLEGQIPNKNLADLLCRHAMNINAYAGNEWWEVKLMIVRAKAAKMQGNVVKTQELALRAQEYCKKYSLDRDAQKIIPLLNY